MSFASLCLVYTRITEWLQNVASVRMLPIPMLPVVNFAIIWQLELGTGNTFTLATFQLVAFVRADEDSAPARRPVGRLRLLSSLHAHCGFRPSILPQRHQRGKCGKNVASVPMLPIANVASCQLSIGNWNWKLATLSHWQHFRNPGLSPSFLGQAGLATKVAAQWGLWYNQRR